MKYLYIIKKITRLIVPVMLLSALLFSTARASAEFYESCLAIQEFSRA